MKKFSLSTNGLTPEGELQVLAMIHPVLDGKSGVRKLNSWQELEEAARANGWNPKEISFDNEVLSNLDKYWGVPQS